MQRSQLEVGQEYAHKSYSAPRRVRIVDVTPTPLSGWRTGNGVTADVWTAPEGTDDRRWTSFEETGRWVRKTIAPRDLTGPWADAVARYRVHRQEQVDRRATEAAVDALAARLGLDADLCRFTYNHRDHEVEVVIPADHFLDVLGKLAPPE